MTQKPTAQIKKAVPQIKKRGLLSYNGEKDDEVIQLNTPELGLLQHLLQNKGRVNPKTGILSFAEGGGPGSGSHDSNHDSGGGSSRGGGGGGGNPGGNGPGNGANANGTGSDSGGVGAGTSTSGKGTSGGNNPTGPQLSPAGLGASLGAGFGNAVGPMSRGLSPDFSGAVDDRGFLDRAKAFARGFFDINRAPTDDPTFNGFLGGVATAVPGMNAMMGITRGLQDATGSMGTPGVANDHANAGMGGPATDVNQAQQQAALAASRGQVGSIPTSIPSLGLLGQFQQPQQQWTVPGYGFQTPGYGYLQWGQK